jgi:hypothetical protein
MTSTSWYSTRTCLCQGLAHTLGYTVNVVRGRSADTPLDHTHTHTSMAHGSICVAATHIYISRFCGQQPRLHHRAPTRIGLARGDAELRPTWIDRSGKATLLSAPGRRGTARAPHRSLEPIGAIATWCSTPILLSRSGRHGFGHLVHTHSPCA